MNELSALTPVAIFAGGILFLLVLGILFGRPKL
jgi:hypothetical protein